jgi:hypothetical protein
MPAWIARRLTWCRACLRGLACGFRAAIRDDALTFVVLFSIAGQALLRSRHHEELSVAIEELRLRPPSLPCISGDLAWS